MRKNTFLGLMCLLLFLCNSRMEAQYGWVQKANYGGGSRTVACGFSIGSTGYILTGDSGGFFNDVWAYDSTTNTWSSKNSFGGTAREGASAVAIGGHGYVIGGKTSTGFVAEVWQYTPGTDSWMKKTSCPGKGRYYGAAIADSANGKIYYGCGDSGAVSYLSDWWEYTPSTDTWKSLTAFAGGQRSWPAGFCINGEIYMGTGNGNDGVNDATNDWWKYDPGTNAWTPEANVPGNLRRDASCFVINGNGYLCLGLDGVSSTVSLSDLRMYDATTNTWTSEASYGAGAAYCAVAFTLGNNAYVGTGFNSASEITGQFWEYMACNSGPESINEVSAGDYIISIFPNPSKGIINVSCNGNRFKNAAIEIIDIYGRSIEIHTNINSSPIILDESALSDGVYFYRIIESGVVLNNGKFIIAK